MYRENEKREEVLQLNEEEFILWGQVYTKAMGELPYTTTSYAEKADKAVKEFCKRTEAFRLSRENK